MTIPRIYALMFPGLLWSLITMATLEAQEVRQYVYLIGDAGEPKTDTIDPVFFHLNKRLMEDGKKASIVFLGDNVYHNGLPPTSLGLEERRVAEKKLIVQLRAVEDFGGEVYFIPGNHDWNDAHPDGIDYIRAQEEFIEFYLDRGDVLIPDHGCPGPEKKKLGKDVVLIAMDSQWWLHPHPDDNQADDCKNRTFDDIITELKSMLDDEDDKHIIIALHHPIYSDGSHNGDYTLKDHLFPLTLLKKNLYLPLPGLGSLYPFYRTAFGARQDMPHPLYQTLREDILEAIAPYDNVVLASGHEHNQQYFYKHQNHFIKSGSGAKSAHLPKVTDAIFSTEEKGFAKLTYFKNDEVTLTFYTIDKDGVEKEAYQDIIVPAPLEFEKSTSPYEVPSQQAQLAASREYLHGGFHRMLFGSLYREDWAAATTFRAMNLSAERGGLKPIKVGGGFSSKSIRLKDDSGDQYVLRSIEKGVAKVVPPGFENTLVQRIFQDQISGSQPYAAIMVPPLADAVGVYHTNPEIVYLPKQAILGDYNDAYGEGLFLYEERPYKDESEEEDFGNSKKVLSYIDVLDRVQDHSKHSIRQEQVLRSRVFDFFLGDWDRHDDQWRWARFKEKNYKGSKETHFFYEPIPRDRDQVFFKYKGLIPNLTKLVSPQTRKFQNFDESIKNIPYLAFNARHFDRSFLNKMNREDWNRMAIELSTNLTDEVIDASIAILPTEVRTLREEEYRRKLQARRSSLPQIADKYYNFLSKYVDVVGTDEREAFYIKRLLDGSTDVTVYQLKKDDDLDDVIYHRVFPPRETREVRLYGMKGKDTFKIEGEHAGGPVIRIIGGKGKDEVEDSSVLRGGNKSVIVYDNLAENDFNLGADAKDNRSDDYRMNQYDRKEFYYDQVVGFPLFSINPDDGLRLGYVHSLSKYGFRKLPYSTKHDFRFGLATARKELALGYDLHAVDVIGNIDFRLTSDYFLPGYVANYFGLSNERSFRVEDAPDFDFFRYQQEDISINPSLEWSTKRGVSRLNIGPYYQHINLRANNNKFIADSRVSGLTDQDFNARNYIGLRADYSLYRVDNPTNPTTGIDFNITPSYNLNLSDRDESFTSLRGSLTLYNFLFIPRPFVLATKLEFGVNWGEFGFPQAHYLGRQNGLRSFYNNRFGGRSSFLVSNDLRLKAFEVKSGAVPFSMGIIGSLDHGRVWADEEQSDRWHTSYGGGIWISPFDVIPISIYYMTSGDQTKQLLIGLGFSF